MTSQPVSAEYLLKGAAYALEQCGRLLRDANILYRSQSYASSVVLTAFAREEFGRWKMLLALRREVAGGKQVTLDDVDSHCGDHIAKQKAGMLSVILRADNNSGLGKLMRAATTSEPGSAEWKDAEKQVSEIQSQLAKRVPGDRHEQRMTALYVDPVSSTDWNRPGEKVTKEFARDFLSDAMNDYSLQQEQKYTKLEFVEAVDPELSKALTDWSNRPKMPPPEWPKFE